MSHECIAAGAFHTLVLAKETGSVWATGCNGSGQLGTSTNGSTPKFANILDAGFQSLAACSSSSYALKDNGDVYSFGWNASGQLGTGTKDTRRTPKKIEEIPPILAIYAGDSFAIFIDHEHSLWVCGCNSYGQLGNGTSTHHITFDSDSTPVTDESSFDEKMCFSKLSFSVAIEQVACGNLHSLFLDNSGTVWGTGWNVYGQLGFCSECDYISSPQKVENLPTMKEISAGWVHSLFLDLNSEVWACGNGEYGNTGVLPTSILLAPTLVNSAGSCLPNIRTICAGRKASYCLDYEGCVYATGSNMYGELGLGDNTNRRSFRKLEGIPVIESLTFGVSHIVMLDLEGRLWGCGCNSRGELPGVLRGSNKPVLLPFSEQVGPRTTNSRNKSARN